MLRDMRLIPRQVLAVLLLGAAALSMTSCRYPTHQPGGVHDDGSSSRAHADGKEADLKSLVKEAAEAAEAWERLSRATRLRAEAAGLANDKTNTHYSRGLWEEGIARFGRDSSFQGILASWEREGMVYATRGAGQEAYDLIKKCEASGAWGALAETAKANAARAEQEWETTLPPDFQEAKKESAFQMWISEGSPAIWRLVESVALSKLALAQVQAEAERAESRHEAAVAAERAAADWAAEAAANVARALSKPPQ